MGSCGCERNLLVRFDADDSRFDPLDHPLRLDTHAPGQRAAGDAAADHMVVGHHVALIVPEEAGACAAGHFHRSELEWRGSCTRRLDVGDARAHTREGVDPPTLNLVHSGRSDFFRSRRTLRGAFLEPADQISLKETKSVNRGQ